MSWIHRPVRWWLDRLTKPAQVSFTCFSEFEWSVFYEELMSQLREKPKSRRCTVVFLSLKGITGVRIFNSLTICEFILFTGRRECTWEDGTKSGRRRRYRHSPMDDGQSENVVVGGKILTYRPTLMCIMDLNKCNIFKLINKLCSILILCVSYFWTSQLV